MHIHRLSPSDRQSADASSAAQSQPPRGAQRVLSSCFGVLGTIALFALPGCPGNLENAQTFNVDDPSLGPAPAVFLEPPACFNKIMTESCASISCHSSKTAIAKLNLDPSNPGQLARRLINAPATHDLAPPDAGCVAGQKLIDPLNPDMSWLLMKVAKTSADLNCGSQMPIGPALSTESLACIQQYVQDAARAAGAGSGGM